MTFSLHALSALRKGRPLQRACVASLCWHLPGGCDVCARLLCGVQCIMTHEHSAHLQALPGAGKVHKVSSLAVQCYDRCRGQRFKAEAAVAITF